MEASCGAAYTMEVRKIGNITNIVIKKAYTHRVIRGILRNAVAAA